MLRSAQHGNIPIELLRTLVLIADLGSVTRAAKAIGLSQPAVSAQIKRLESLIAGELFVKRGRPVQLSERGQAILSYARRIVALSDQLQAVAGGDTGSARVRIGLPAGIDSALIVDIFNAVSMLTGKGVFINCDVQRNLLRSLDSGYLEAAFFADLAPVPATAAVEWSERWHWIKGADYVLNPEAPVPIVSWPGSLSDRLCITALRQANVNHHIAFVGCDRSLRKSAVNAGIGLMAASERSVHVSGLCIARARCLPDLPAIRSGIYLRDGLERKQAEYISHALTSVLNPGGGRVWRA